MIYRLTIDHLKLTQAFTDIQVPFELCAMIILAVVFAVAMKYRVYTDFPGNLFIWVLSLDFFHGIFILLRWTRLSEAAYNALGNPDTMSNAMCAFNAFIDTFFQLGSLFTNTAIIASVFYMVFFTADFRAYREVNTFFKVTFWAFTLPLSVPVLFVTPYRGLGWCTCDSLLLVLKQIVWTSSIILQVIMVIPTNYKIYKTSLVNVKGVSKGTYLRFCGIVFNQIIGLFPTLIAEFNGMVRSKSTSQALLYMVVIGLPLGQLLDALLMSIKVLPHLSPFFRSLLSAFDSSKGGTQSSRGTATTEEDTKDRSRGKSPHRLGSRGRSSGHIGRHENNAEGSKSHHHHSSVQIRAGRREREKQQHQQQQPSAERGGGGGDHTDTSDVEMASAIHPSTTTTTTTTNTTNTERDRVRSNPTTSRQKSNQTRGGEHRHLRAEERLMDPPSSLSQQQPSVVIATSSSSSAAAGGGAAAAATTSSDKIILMNEKEIESEKMEELRPSTSAAIPNPISTTPPPPPPTTTTTTTATTTAAKGGKGKNSIITNPGKNSNGNDNGNNTTTASKVSRLKRHQQSRCGILTQVFWALVLPLILLSVACLTQAAYKYATAKQDELLLASLQIAKPCALLVDLLEEEGAGASIFLASNHTNFQMSMKTNSEETDIAIIWFKETLMQYAPQSLLDRPETQNVLTALNSVHGLRGQVYNGSITVPAALNAYGDVTAQLVEMLVAATDSERIDTISSKLFSFSMVAAMHVLGTVEMEREIDLKNAFDTDGKLDNHLTEYAMYARSLGDQEPALKFYTILSANAERLKEVVDDFVPAEENTRYRFYSQLNDSLLETQQQQQQSLNESIIPIEQYLDAVYTVAMEEYNELVTAAQGKYAPASRNLRLGVVFISLIPSYFGIALFVVVYGIDTILHDVHALQARYEGRSGRSYAGHHLGGGKGGKGKGMIWRACQLLFSFKMQLVIAFFVPIAVSFAVLMDVMHTALTVTQSTTQMLDSLTLGVTLVNIVQALSREAISVQLYIAAAAGAQVNSSSLSGLTAEMHARFAQTDGLFQANANYLLQQFESPILFQQSPYYALMNELQQLPLTRNQFLLIDSSSSSDINSTLVTDIYTSIANDILDVVLAMPLIASDGVMDQQLVGYISAILAQFGTSSERLEGYTLRNGNMMDLDAYGRFNYAVGIQRSYASWVRTFSPTEALQTFTDYEETPVHQELEWVVQVITANDTAIIQSQVHTNEWYDQYLDDIDALSEVIDEMGDGLLNLVIQSRNNNDSYAAWLLGGYIVTLFLAIGLVVNAQRKLRSYSELMEQLLTYEDKRVQGYLRGDGEKEGDVMLVVERKQADFRAKKNSKEKDKDKDRKSGYSSGGGTSPTTTPRRSHSLPSLGIGPGSTHDPALSQLAEIMSEAHNVLPEISLFFRWVARTDAPQRDKELHDFLVPLQQQRASSTSGELLLLATTNSNSNSNSNQPQFWPELLTLASDAKSLNANANANMDPTERKERVCALISKAEQFYVNFGLQQLKISSFGKQQHSPPVTPRRSSTFAGRTSTPQSSQRRIGGGAGGGAGAGGAGGGAGAGGAGGGASSLRPTNRSLNPRHLLST